MRGSVFLLAFLSFVLVSCGPRGLPGIPVDDSFKVLLPQEAARILASQHQGAGQLQTLKVSADVTVSKGLGKRSFLQSFVYAAPDQARIESFVPAVNQLISLVIVNSQLIFVRDNRESSSYIAEPTPENIAKLIHLPLYPLDLAQFLTGVGVPHHVFEEVEVSRAKSSGGEILRTIFSREPNQRIEQYFRRCGGGAGIESEGFRLVGLRIFERGQSAEQVWASLKYDGENRSGGFDSCKTPRAISLELRTEGLTAEIVVRNIRQNESLKPGLFQVPVQ